jgi:hypothetical protein
VGNPDGLALHRLVEPFGRCTPVAREAVERLADALNDRVIKGFEDLGEKPAHVAVTRNKLRAPINMRIALHEAQRRGVRPIFWRSQDSVVSYATANGKDASHAWKPKTAELPPEICAAIAELPASECDWIGSFNMFFPGIEYLAADSDAPHAGRSKNNRCIGRRLVLHPKEPPLDESGDIVMLQYLPSAIIVEPEDSSIGDACSAHSDDVPHGCIPIAPRATSHSIRVALPKPVAIPGTPHEATSVTFTRKGIPLDDGYCVTDYFCQGVSFGSECWIIHAAQPPGRHGLSRTSLYVLTTRYAALSHVRVLAPLWNTPEERESYIDALLQSSQMDQDLAREFQRLDALWETTLRTNAALARECGIEEVPSGGAAP